MVLEDFRQVSTRQDTSQVVLAQGGDGRFESLIRRGEDGVRLRGLQHWPQARLVHCRQQVSEAASRRQLHDVQRQRELQHRPDCVDHPVPALHVGRTHHHSVYQQSTAVLTQGQVFPRQGFYGRCRGVSDHDLGRDDVVLQQLGQALLVRPQLIEGHRHLREVGLESRIGRSEHREGPGAGQGIHQLRASEGLYQSGGVAAGLGNLNDVGHEQLVDGVHDPVAGLRRRCRKGDPVNENL
mmetsp:Transcript_81682/g.218572  ORF Transcript_81682/g.218572 Transcript_81682/m.218572 type:complete len:239 (-) Transcript_81682:908-1624(-)